MPPRIEKSEPATRLEHESRGQCKPAYRKWLLGFAVFHLLAVVAEPLFFYSRSEVQAGPEFLALRRGLGPYVDWMYLDHGYFFFAPNPGPSHLVGIRDQSVVFPDRKEQWPRLLYHRYFMLSEFYNNSFAPTALDPQDMTDKFFVARWEEDRRFYQTLQRSISKSIQSQWNTREETRGNDRIESLPELVRLERPLPGPLEVLSGSKRLGDSRDLIVLPEGPESPPTPAVPTPAVPTPAVPTPAVPTSEGPVQGIPIQGVPLP
jgi:hypothetical protein